MEDATQSPFVFLWPYLRRNRRGFILGFGALTMKDLLGAALPLVIRAAIDGLTAHAALKTLFLWAGLLVALSAIKGLFQYWMRVILISISRDIEYDLRNDLFARLMTLDASFYRRTRTGDVLARATNDMNAVRMMLGPGIMYWFETSLTLVLAVSVMLLVDWPLTLVALAPAPFISIAVLYFGRRIHERFQSIQEQFSGISSRVQESFSGVRVVRAYVEEQQELRKFEQLNREYIDENLRLAKISGLFNPVLQALVGISFLLVLWMGGTRLAEHKISIGSFVMFNTYMGILVWPMIAMGWVANLMERGKASLERVRAVLREEPRIAAPARPRPLPNPVAGEIEFRDVSFAYQSGADDHFSPSANPNAGRPQKTMIRPTALRGVNLTIPAGSTVAIVGHTGSGKTTLAQLIPRLTDPHPGSVFLDGADLKEFDPRQLRSTIGYVPQETFLFSATLRENIAFGVASATDAEIARVVEIAGLTSDIEGFPNGLDTVVGERGITLSGGQKQRTAIARALLRDPRILILDDALASVDTATEEKILSGLAGVMRGRTTILISHRVSTIQGADTIVVLENGEVAAQGTHAELLARGGYYAALVEKQLLEEELESA
jgi:ATP-binding cassette, subfamily B, multidrug efflux pump